jgi:hypothetical protein
MAGSSEAHEPETCNRQPWTEARPGAKILRRDADNFYRPFFKWASAKSRKAFQSEVLMMCAPV